MSKASARPQTRYVCQSCGESFLRWEGQCRACSAWNSLVETQVRSEPRTVRASVGGPSIGAAATRLADVGEPARVRLPVGIGELDRVLGGGLVPGSLVLVGGEPGIGKSTLLLQAAAGVAALVGPERVLYATAKSRRPRSGCARSGSAS
jgi:DNA repair protein RadA/Sms